MFEDVRIPLAFRRIQSADLSDWEPGREHAGFDELVEALEIRQPTVSHHLKVLRDRGLVTTTREGNAIRYELRDHRVVDALDLLRAVMGDMLAEQAKLVGAVS